MWLLEPTIPAGYGQLLTLPVLVTTLGFSRLLTATMVPSRQAGDILGGMWQLFNGLGMVPKALIWDRESAIGGTGIVTVRAASFAGSLSTRIQLAPPWDPKFKGMVQRNNGYFETWLLPGCSFASPADFNTKLDGWLPKANHRVVRFLGQRPDEVLSAELEAMTLLAGIHTVYPAAASDAVGPGVLRSRRLHRLLRRLALHGPLRRYLRHRHDGHDYPRWRDRRRPGAMLGPPGDDIRSRPREHRQDPPQAVAEERFVQERASRQHADGTPEGRQIASTIAYLARLLKTLTTTRTREGLAGTARQSGRSHEKYLAMVLQYRVADREAHGTA